MKNELLRENRNRILFAVIVALALSVMLLTLQARQVWMTSKNDWEIESEISQLAYTEEAANAEMKRLQPLTELAPVSDGTNGKLYQALAEISYMTGDETLYSQYVAYALHYLGEIGDDVSCVYLTNKFIGRLYANGSYPAAEEMLRGLSESTDISALPLTLQASYYLSCADIARMQQKDDSDFLALGRAAIRLLPDGGERRLNEAKADILTARGLIEHGAYDEAEALMSAYSETDDFGLGHDQVYVVCDFKIPFYEISAKLALHAQDADALELYVTRYMEYCEEYRFRAMELHLLQYVAANTPDADAQPKNRYAAMQEQISQGNLTDMTDKYGQFLILDVGANMHDIAQMEEEQAAGHRRMLYAAIFVYAAVLLFCMANVLISYMNKDGLTRLGSRRQYERMRIHCERRRIPYCLLMLDIDDFKKINDHFGHERGDEALRAISGVLHSYSGRGIFSYRYGGEELCLMLLHVPEKRSREIAEEIRKTVEETIGGDGMHITVIIGVACSKNGENIFREADMKLYEAKESGKNRVC